MKILLLGEYSRLHNSLKEGLTELGHQVVLVGYKDYFKEYDVDIEMKLNYHHGFKKFLRKLLFKFFSIDLHSRSVERFFYKNLDLFSGYDVVQLINESTFKTVSKTEIKLLEYLFKNNSKVFLLSCGADYPSINYANSKSLKYSILTPLHNGKVSKKEYSYLLNYLGENHQKLHDFIFNNIDGVIASDIDYHLPLKNSTKYLGLIPNPINTDILDYLPLKPTDVIKIFHGINEFNYYKKGHDIIEEALKIIKNKYKDKVEILTTKNLAYKQYIKSYDNAHIVMDQVYSYDQGYNALEAMAKGKVVFSGAESEWLSVYNIEENTVLINAIPDIEAIVEKLEWIINNPEVLVKISENARKFVEDHHNYIEISKQYLNTWNPSL